MDQSIRDTRRSSFMTKVLFIMIPVLVAGGILLQQIGHQKIREVRTLERIPPTTVIASLPGPNELSGQVRQESGTTLLEAHWTDEPCVWYRAVKEVETRDSEGNTSWDTVFDKQDGIPFELGDETGVIRVVTNDRVDFDMKRDWRRKSGKERFTEYRITVGDEINIVGMRSRERDEIDFPEAGAYLPIVSDGPIANARSSRAIISTLLVIASVLAIASACACTLIGLRLFNTMGFAIMVGVCTGGSLIGGGVIMMMGDLSASNTSVLRQVDAADEIAARDFPMIGIEWTGAWQDRTLFERASRSEAPGPRLAAIRETLAARIARSRDIRSRFPQNVIASMTDLEPLPEILSAGETVPVSIGRITTARPFWLIPTLIAGCALLITVIFSMIGFRKVKTKRLIENIPTTPASDLEIGVCELAGTLRSCPDIAPLEGPLTDEPCVWYRYQIQEWRGSGKNRRLHTVLDRTRRQQCLCEDDSGSVPVDLEDARIICGRTASRSRGNRVYTESSLRADDPIYILGSAELDPMTGDSLLVRKDPQGLPYLVSNLPESRVKGKEITSAFWLLALGIGSSSGIIMGLLLFSGRLAAVDQMLAALASTGLLVLLVIAIMYNDLVFLRQRTDWARSNIDVALRKRADLLPRLQSVTSGYMQHEAEVQPILAGLRTAWNAPIGDNDQAERSVRDSRAATNRLMALREQYPDLKANEVTERLLRVIVTLENEIAARRSGYNAAVQRYLARTHSIPEVFLARLFGFKERRPLGWDVEILRMAELDFQRETRTTEELGAEETLVDEVDEVTEELEKDVDQTSEGDSAKA